MIRREPKALTGVRPTGELTIGNYLGAIQPVVNMQEEFDGPIGVFVADIHGLTDQEPKTVSATRLVAARALLAAGVDTSRTSIYLQSQIENQTLYLANLFDRHTTPAELERVPTLKDKLKNDHSASNVNLSLFRYPVLMAADIAIQDATHVPVGEDQLSHLELTRRLVRRFNTKYDATSDGILVEPKSLARKSLRIAALNARDGKMSKSRPKSAILLRDSADEVAKKVRKAQTALPGEMNDTLDSHFMVAELLSTDSEDKDEVLNLKKAHLDGEMVMADFKNLLTDRLNDFLTDFRDRYENIDEKDVKLALAEGGEQARDKANEVTHRVRNSLGLDEL